MWGLVASWRRQGQNITVVNSQSKGPNGRRDRDEMLYHPYVVLPPRGSTLCVRSPDIRQTDTLKVPGFDGLSFRQEQWGKIPENGVAFWSSS